MPTVLHQKQHPTTCQVSVSWVAHGASTILPDLSILWASLGLLTNSTVKQLHKNIELLSTSLDALTAPQKMLLMLHLFGLKTRNRGVPNRPYALLRLSKKIT